MASELFRSKAEEIRFWLKNQDNCLLLTGARQVGKTHLIRSVINSEPDYQLVEFNFLSSPDILESFRDANSAFQLLLRIKLFASRQGGARTVIFFDEIQEFPEIVTMIKFLVEEGSFRYILSGSLLGVSLKNISSAPVGYMSVMTLYPLTLFEFLTALGVSSQIIELLADHFRSLTPVDQAVHSKMIELFHLYLLVGGMPQAVMAYLETADISYVGKVLSDIVELYKLDFCKYEEQDGRLRLIDVYQQVPCELNKENKRFFLSSLGRDARHQRYRPTFEWLTGAGVACPVYCVREPRQPLGQSKKSSMFKLFLNDVGLLSYRFSPGVKLRLLDQRLEENHGMLFESVVAQELIANECQVYYYSRQGVGEVDFVTAIDDQVIALEVKSGAGYKTHAALDNLLSRGHYQLRPFVLSPSNIERVGEVTYLPLYMVMFFKREERGELIRKVDLSVLGG